VARSRKRPRSSRKGRVVLAALVFALALYGTLLWGLYRVGGGEEGEVLRPSSDEERAAERADPAPRAERIERAYDYDIFDERRLVGHSENVFLGEVLRVAGREPMRDSIPDGVSPPTPQTQYRVRVVRVIKSSGDAPLRAGAETVVNAAGGTNEDGLPTVVAAVACGREGTDVLPKPGEAYLFATRHDGSDGWQELTAQPGGAVPAGEGAEREALLAAYAAASKRQVDPFGGEETPCAAGSR
jgi:hypothetical protein